MARKASTLAKKSLATVFLVLFLYAVFNILHSSTLDPSDPIPRKNLQTPANGAVKIYLYDLPHRFTYGVIRAHARARGGASPADPHALSYPGHQHMAEWHLYSDLLRRPDPDLTPSPVTRVADPDQADLFFVPFLSSLSLIVNTASAAASASAYSDEAAQEDLVRWLEGREHWRRNGGRDHVLVASDPNALYKVIDTVRSAVLLVSDFGRLKSDQGSLVKDVVLPYSHRVNSFKGGIGVEDRRTLLFFMGARFRKEGGKIRNLLFELLENEEDVVVKHGVQSRENRRAATHGMHTSKFCLNPAGDTPSACRLFDSIVSLCIPVIISDDIELPFEDVIDYRNIAIFVETTVALKPGYLVLMLRGISDKRILEYQRALKEAKQYFEYGSATINEIWRQVGQKLPLIKSMINREKRLVKTNLTEPDCSCLCSNQAALMRL